ncbi:MAG: hypothetical protein ACREXY_24595 [Gammaproteobacteria bacterium]
MNANAESILLDPTYSEWFKAALRSALDCDPIFVANECDALRAVLMRRVAEDCSLDSTPEPAVMAP